MTVTSTRRTLLFPVATRGWRPLFHFWLSMALFEFSELLQFSWNISRCFLKDGFDKIKENLIYCLLFCNKIMIWILLCSFHHTLMCWVATDAIQGFLIVITTRR